MHRIISFALLATWSVGAQDFQRLKARGEREILTPGKSWELLGEGYHLTADAAVDNDGVVYFTDARRNRILKVDLEGKISTWKEGSNDAHGIAYGPDGRLYAGQHDPKRIAAFARDGTESVISEGMQSHHLMVTSRNHIYFTVPPARQVWLVDAARAKRVVHEGLNWPRGVRASPDESRLVVNDAKTNLVWLFQIQADGSLTGGRAFYRLETKGEKSETDPGGMAFDTGGLLYVATLIGIQVCDQRGAVTAILEAPFGEGVANVFFAGPGLQWLYVTDGNKLYRRLVKRRGAGSLKAKAQ